MVSHPVLYAAPATENVDQPLIADGDSNVEPLIDEVLDLYEAAGTSRIDGLKIVLSIGPDPHDAWVEQLQRLADELRAA